MLFNGGETIKMMLMSATALGVRASSALLLSSSQVRTLDSQSGNAGFESRQEHLVKIVILWEDILTILLYRLLGGLL